MFVAFRWAQKCGRSAVNGPRCLAASRGCFRTRIGWDSIPGVRDGVTSSDLGYNEQMQASCALATIVLVLTGCASSGTSGQTASLIPPEFRVRVVRVPESRPTRANVFTSEVEVEVFNRSSETLTLDRIQVSSVGDGAYTIPPVTKTFNLTIAPNQARLVRIFVQVVAEETLTGAEEPIFVRGIAEFRSEVGGFRRIFTQRVNPSTLQRPGRG